MKAIFESHGPSQDMDFNYSRFKDVFSSLVKTTLKMKLRYELQIEDESSESDKIITEKDRYFYHPESDDLFIVKKGKNLKEEINEFCEELSYSEYNKLKVKIEDERSEEEEEPDIPDYLK